MPMLFLISFILPCRLFHLFRYTVQAGLSVRHTVNLLVRGASACRCTVWINHVIIILGLFSNLRVESIDCLANIGRSI